MPRQSMEYTRKNWEKARRCIHFCVPLALTQSWNSSYKKTTRRSHCGLLYCKIMMEQCPKTWYFCTMSRKERGRKRPGAGRPIRNSLQPRENQWGMRAGSNLPMRYPWPKVPKRHVLHRAARTFGSIWKVEFERRCLFIPTGQKRTFLIWQNVTIALI